MIEIIKSVIEKIITDPGVIAVIILMGYFILKKIALKSKTKKDDEYIEKIENFASQAFSLVESIDKTGGIALLLKTFGVSGKSEAKLRKAVEVFSDKYRIENDKYPNADVLEYAGKIFKDLAFDDKYLKEIIAEAVKDALKKTVIKKKR